MEETQRSLQKEESDYLVDVNGRADPYTMTAILGPSGSGKTTLLNSLAGRIPSDLTLKGEILVNSYPRNMLTWPKIVSYVNQQFFAHEHQTVYETFEFVGNVKFGAKEEIFIKIEELITLLGLDSVRDNYLLNLSGGERMRVSIGIELLGDPLFYFLMNQQVG